MGEVEDFLIRLFHPDEEQWPHWARHLMRRMNEVMGVSEDVRQAVADLSAAMDEVTTYATSTQAELQSLHDEINALEAGQVDEATIQSLKDTVAAIKAKADALVGTAAPADQPSAVPAPDQPLP